MTEVSVIDPISGEPARFLFTARDNRGLPGSFDYWRADNGHVFLHPVPDNLGDHYAAGYQSIPRDETELAKAATEDAYRVEPIRALVPSGTFLEIGSWIGLTAYSAKVAGYAVSVFERDEQCVDLLRRSGIDAIQSNDPAATFKETGRSFDVVGLWHSIEHLPRPWEVIERAAQAVNPGGVLVIAAPNPDSAQFRVCGKHWVHLDAPRHIHFLPMALVEAIAHSQGLVTVSRSTDDTLATMLEEHGWRWELHRRVRRIPLIRAIAYRLFWRAMKRRHRKGGELNGAAYAVMMMRPADRPGPWDRPV